MSSLLVVAFTILGFALAALAARVARFVARVVESDMRAARAEADRDSDRRRRVMAEERVALVEAQVEEIRVDNMQIANALAEYRARDQGGFAILQPETPCQVWCVACGRFVAHPR